MAIDFFNRFGFGTNNFNNLQQKPIQNLPGGNQISLGMGGGGNAMAANPFSINTFNTMTPNLNRGGFTRGIGGALSNIGGFVQNNQRFGDALAGAAILGGTPIADAFAVRETINPTDNTIGKSVGSIFNVKNSTTNRLTGEQVFSTDSKRMDEIAADPNLELVKPAEATEQGKIRTDFESYTDDEGRSRQRLISGTETFQNYRDDVFLNINSLRNAKRYLTNDIRDMDFIITESENAGVVQYLFGKVKFTDEFAVKKRLSRLETQQFIKAINEMRTASKTGGAVGSVTEKEMQALAQSKVELELGDPLLISELLELRGDLLAGFADVLTEVRSKNADLNKSIAEADPSGVIPIPEDLYVFSVPEPPVVDYRKMSDNTQNENGSPTVINKYGL